MLGVEVLLCLALNIYHEARSEPFIGQLAVSQVVINRVYDKRFPNDVCSVVFQGPVYKHKKSIPVKHKCQFSWYCDGKSDKPIDKDAFNKAKDIALYSLSIHNREKFDFMEGATHYHASYVLPGWSTKKDFIVQIGKHRFYRWN
jgi:spore germination cell wall hydrolase CwlJ-like protein|tara:strand:- start:3187 stop:3618 length:432 start_codon:yes stop_codon:yes gene_type:complete